MRIYADMPKRNKIHKLIYYKPLVPAGISWFSKRKEVAGETLLRYAGKYWWQAGIWVDNKRMIWYIEVENNEGFIVFVKADLVGFGWI